ncbi:MAG TPA: hypothetical protein VK519_12900 [Pinirhizobacter sp.]|uniref:hypothetical protein n=1 Tax=Pinirhizobacter sp. TaxID=2950432 RepID=UPI002C748BE3|nr:hypothetical protein [Pinirhizobacter sp.]HMH68805.1 hypothetical protein [Pinirhizobacter sp.]
MKRIVHGRLSLRFLTTEEGGRRGAVDAPAYGYRPTAEIDGKFLDIRIVPAIRMELGPTYEVEVAFLDIVNARPHLAVGRELTILEGGKVGTATILELADGDHQTDG